MIELVLLHHNEPMTTSLAIAEGTENTHQAILKLVKTYINQLQEFGRVGFEIRPFDTAGGIQTREVAFLNEPQATLLITFLRNSEIVVRFKVALVKAFFELRDRLRNQAPQFTTRQLDHGADLAVAADRTFRSFLRSARSAGMKLPQALRCANKQTVARTGMDMLAELEYDPDAEPARPTYTAELIDPFADALTQWAQSVEPGSRYRMGDILRAVCGIEQGSKEFQRQSPIAGRLLRRLGWSVRHERVGGSAPFRHWTKR